jgi:hypothetical protein
MEGFIKLLLGEFSTSNDHGLHFRKESQIDRESDMVHWPCPQGWQSKLSSWHLISRAVALSSPAYWKLEAQPSGFSFH